MTALRTAESHGPRHSKLVENQGVKRRGMLALRGGRNTAWLRGRGSVRVRLAVPRITCSVLVRDCYSSGSSYARGETKNADKSRTSHRTHPRDTHLRTRELDDHFCADHHVAGDAVHARASAVDHGAALGRGDCYQLAVFCFCSFPRTGTQYGGAHL